MIVLSTLMTVFIVAEEQVRMPVWAIVLFHLFDFALLTFSMFGVMVDIAGSGVKKFWRNKWHL